MDTNLILSICQIVAVSVIPLIVWYLGNKWQEKKSKEDAKMSLFLTLMANRKSVFVTKEWVDALNKIDVVFQDNKKVRKAWREYYDSLDEKSQFYAQRDLFLLDLLSEMANSLGYEGLKQTEIARFYNPQAFCNQQKTVETLNKELIRVLMHSKNNAEGFTEEEYQQYLSEI